MKPVKPDRRLEDERTALSKDAIKNAFLDDLFYMQGKFPALATNNDYYMALAYAVRDRMLQRWISTAAAYTKQGSRTVAYLSAEFLMGPHLGNNLINLGIFDTVNECMTELGMNFEQLLAQEEEPGLGNGGLGRLAACFIDSLATLEVPALGYGIRYEFGIFHQEIVDGWQSEKTDKWLRYGNPWELVRPEWSVDVKFGGSTEQYIDEHNRLRVRWVPHKIVCGVPYDTLILGYRTNTANTLRLWRSEAPESFDFAIFNSGDYYGAVNQKVTSENLSKVLYPNDQELRGKELRLEQQYFFVSCSLQDMFRIIQRQKLPVEKFHEKFAVQLNDTHPAIAIAELMRLLPEALERWSLAVFGSVLPRHLQIIYEINAHFLEEVRMRYLGDEARISRLSLIDESGERYVRMAHLACVGSHAINGVAQLHSELLKRDVLRDFYELWPQKFSNKTNGVTPRRWMVLCNPRLSELITEHIGDGWIKDLSQLRRLEPLADDAEFRNRWHAIKQHNKRAFASLAVERTGIVADPESMFDVLVKRIHEYKRQHLKVLHIVSLYHAIKNNPSLAVQPRTFIFGGKAAPGYHLAKLMIKLITAVGEVVNRDPDVRDRLKVVFLPNFNVTNGQRVYPAADLSEQISTAGKEASGTGNMKFSMNGALTIGTLDGANIEIREEVGAENFFLFGLSAEEVYSVKARGYRPMDYYNANQGLRDVIDLIRSGYFSRGDTELFRPLIDGLMHQDPYLLLADFQSYVECQERVAEAYRDEERWTRMSILNTARSGKFSSDRTIREYCADIWHVKSMPINLLTHAEAGIA
jgi:starch phosphorylase